MGGIDSEKCFDVRKSKFQTNISEGKADFRCNFEPWCLWSDLSEILHDVGPLDPDDMKNTQGKLPWQRLLWSSRALILPNLLIIAGDGGKGAFCLLPWPPTNTKGGVGSNFLERVEEQTCMGGGLVQH